MPALLTLSSAQARAAAEVLEAAALAHDGHASLGEAVWRDLEAPQPESATFAVDGDGHPVALVHVAPSDTFAAQHWAVGLVVHPDARDEHDVIPSLLEGAVRHVGAHGGGDIVAWRFDPDERDDLAMRAAGFRVDRELLQMRVGLPLDVDATLPAGTELRTFEVGRDEAAWLEVNNRAFDNHPEQGSWVSSTLERRMAEPWFDPELFLLAFDADGLIGFNWLKVHDAHHRDPRLGEIFVIGVDPRAQGTGLGRTLTVIGLDRLAARGIETGMLFVDGANVAARRLYESVGFHIHRVDRAYRRHVAA